jgi:hypothetical protein
MNKLIFLCCRSLKYKNKLAVPNIRNGVNNYTILYYWYNVKNDIYIITKPGKSLRWSNAIYLWDIKMFSNRNAHN